jgi:amino acid transporter
MRVVHLPPETRGDMHSLGRDVLVNVIGSVIVAVLGFFATRFLGLWPNVLERFHGDFARAASVTVYLFGIAAFCVWLPVSLARDALKKEDDDEVTAGLALAVVAMGAACLFFAYLHFRCFYYLVTDASAPMPWPYPNW